MLHGRPYGRTELMLKALMRSAIRCAKTGEKIAVMVPTHEHRKNVERLIESWPKDLRDTIEFVVTEDTIKTDQTAEPDWIKRPAIGDEPGQWRVDWEENVQLGHSELAKIAGHLQALSGIEELRNRLISPHAVEEPERGSYEMAKIHEETMKKKLGIE